MNKTVKTILFLVLAIVVVIIGIPVASGFLSTFNPSKAVQMAKKENSANQQVDNNQPQNNNDLVTFVKQKLVDLCKAEPQNIIIAVDKIEQDYAIGNGACGKDSPGFYWAAAKIQDQWSYYMGGNGIPNCKDIEIFPPTVFGGKFKSCLNSNGELIERK